MLGAAMPEEAGALVAALGIREVPCGELDLTPRAFDRARAERGCRLFARGPRPTTG